MRLVSPQIEEGLPEKFLFLASEISKALEVEEGLVSMTKSSKFSSFGGVEESISVEVVGDLDIAFENKTFISFIVKVHYYYN